MTHSCTGKENVLKKLAVFIPGIGYTVDHPLLYYSGKLSAQMGYEPKRLIFTGFPKKVIGDSGRMYESFLIASRLMEEQMQDIHPEDWDRIVFISKSIGTIVASDYQKNHGIEGDNVYFTPVADTFRFIRDASGIAFHGTNDPWTADVSVEDLCHKHHIPCTLLSNADHSLETGDVWTDMDALSKIMRQVQSYLAG